MRLISGEYGGRALKTINAPGLRPAMGRTREALFSMLEAQAIDWQSTKALDLFAGCGSIGFECLSRGAAEVWFVENDHNVFACLQENSETLGCGNKCRLWQMDAMRFLRQAHAAAFDLVFIDPPYRKNYIEKCLHALTRNGWLNDEALIITETETGLKFNPPQSLTAEAIKNFGQTNTHIFHYHITRAENENSALSRDI